jgi:hypothetical protein
MMSNTAIMRCVALALLLGLAMTTPRPAAAQCPNNCTGHGTCVPSPETRRFVCECHEGWTGSACSRRESANAKAKEPEPEIIVDIPEEESGDSKRRGRPAAGVRPFDEVASDSWGDLQPAEQTLLKNLGWEKGTWNSKRSARTPWPPAMYQPFDILKAKEQSAVLGLGLTPREWNTGKHVAILTERGV